MRTIIGEYGHISSSNRMKHIEIRYFFVKDRVDKREKAIEYCPTGIILMYYFTKPLQGN